MDSSVQTQQHASASKPMPKEKSMGDHLSGFMDMFSTKKSAAAKVGGRSRRHGASRRRGRSASRRRSKSASRRRSKSASRSRSRSASRRRSKSRRGGNPDKGQASMTRMGNQDFVTHKGDMSYNRDGHRQASNSMGMVGSPYGAAKAKTMKKAAAKGAAASASKAATAAKGVAKAASRAAKAAKGASASKAMGASKAVHAAAGKASAAGRAAAMGASAAAAAHKAAPKM